jgi:hypothetical protein
LFVYKKNTKVIIAAKTQNSKSETRVMNLPGESNPLIILYISNIIPIKNPAAMVVTK